MATAVSTQMHGLEKDRQLSKLEEMKEKKRAGTLYKDLNPDRPTSPAEYLPAPNTAASTGGAAKPNATTMKTASKTVLNLAVIPAPAMPLPPVHRPNPLEDDRSPSHKRSESPSSRFAQPEKLAWGQKPPPVIIPNKFNSAIRSLAIGGGILLILGSFGYIGGQASSE